MELNCDLESTFGTGRMIPLKGKKVVDRTSDGTKSTINEFDGFQLLSVKEIVSR